MICQVCSKKNIQKIKTIQGVDIFECKNCYLAFLDQRKTLKFDPQNEYNLEKYKENEAKLRRQFEKITDKIYRYKKRGKVLDIGAGYGLLSSILLKKGYEIEIIEPISESYYLRGKKIKHYRGTVEKFLSRNKTKYNIILLIDLIEHLKNPLVVLKKLRMFLNRDGIIVIQTPNYKSLMARICINWSWWMVSDHKFFFSPRSIRLLVQKAGFSISNLNTFEDIHDFKKNLDGNFTSIKNPFMRKMTKGFMYTCFFPLYFLFRKIIWVFAYGGLILAYNML
ncbi:class I SAM-dependent methyltransferase [Candidatus Roizmanbacteria bacterium]|nr:class I SAM-dependent methyltransferase [Candidatus Roizmanbacteria bacterium]